MTSKRQREKTAQTVIVPDANKRTDNILEDCSNKAIRSRCADILDEVQAENREAGRASTYLDMLCPSYWDDLVRIAGMYRGGSIVEIGGYPFYFSRCLQKLGVNLEIVDLAPQRAQDFIERHKLRVYSCDIEREPLPFEESSVAMIVFCATFEHLRQDPFFTLQEIKRVIRPDGVLYLTTPNLYRLGNVLSFVLGNGLAFDPIGEYSKLNSVGHMGHVREYTASELHRFLTLTGFKNVEIRTRAIPSQRGKLVDLVHLLLPSIRGELIAVARLQPPL